VGLIGLLFGVVDFRACRRRISVKAESQGDQATRREPHEFVEHSEPQVGAVHLDAFIAESARVKEIKFRRQSGLFGRQPVWVVHGGIQWLGVE
jgi:hypothetical protein